MDKFFHHETSVIDDGAKIGAGTKIWHFSHIMTGARIGEGVTIGQNVVVSPGVTIGNGTKIQNNVSVYTGVTVEDDVFLGPSMVFTNVINPRAFIERKDEFRTTIVRKGASIGANATVVCGVTVGEYALVGAGSVIARDVEPHALMVGNPARKIGYVCTCGTTLTSDGDCPDCGKHYETLRLGKKEEHA